MVHVTSAEPVSSFVSGAAAFLLSMTLVPLMPVSPAVYTTKTVVSVLVPSISVLTKDLGAALLDGVHSYYMLVQEQFLFCCY